MGVDKKCKRVRRQTTAGAFAYDNQKRADLVVRSNAAMDVRADSA
jgi:hypothetical protein